MMPAGCQWLTPSYSRGRESGGSWFEASLGKQFAWPYLKNTHPKRAGGVAQGEGPEFKQKYCKKKKKKKVWCLKPLRFKKFVPGYISLLAKI
jgi:hypothetical protein